MPLLTQQDRVRMGGRRRRPEYEATVEAQSPYVPAVDAARQEDEYRTGLMALENERIDMERANQSWREQADAENRRLADEAQEESMNLGYAGLGVQAGKLGYDLYTGGSMTGLFGGGAGAATGAGSAMTGIGSTFASGAGSSALAAEIGGMSGGMSAGGVGAGSLGASGGAASGSAAAGLGLGTFFTALAPLAIAYGLLKAYDPTTQTSQSPIPGYGLALQQGIIPDQSSDQAIQYRHHLETMFQVPDPNYQPRDGEFEGAYQGMTLMPEAKPLIDEFMNDPFTYLEKHGGTLENPFINVAPDLWEKYPQPGFDNGSFSGP